MKQLVTPADLYDKRLDVLNKNKAKLIIRPLSRLKKDVSCEDTWNQIDVPTLLFLMYTISLVTESGNRYFEFLPEHYQMIRGISIRGNLLKELRVQAVEQLRNVKIEYMLKSRYEKKMCIFDEIPSIKNGKIHGAFTAEFYDIIYSEEQTTLPLAIFKLEKGRQTATAPLILWHISQHTEVPSTELTVDISTLYSACGNLRNILKDELDYSGHVQQSIITPFEKALNTLAEHGLIRWRYSQKPKKGWASFICERLDITILFR